jgi:hypothetical protein
VLKAFLALVCTSTQSWNDQPHAYNDNGSGYTWSTDCIDGDEQVLIVNEYIETIIKNPIIKDYLVERVAECDKE